MSMRFARLLAILSLLAGACGFPPSALAQDDLFAIVNQQVEMIRAAEPIYSDSFRYDDDSWDTEAGDATLPYYAAGTLRLWVTEPNTVGYSMSNWEAGDFFLEVDTYHTYGPIDNSFGIIFRFVDELNFYYFAVSSDGYYAFYRYIDGEWETLIDWTETDALASGEGAANWLGVYAVGSRITLLANHTIVEIVEDDTFDYGGIALAVESLDEPSVEVAFDDLRLWGVENADLSVVEPEPTLTPTPAFILTDAPTVTPTPTAIPTLAPTPMPTPTPDEVAAVAEIRRGQPDYADDFQAESGEWPLHTDEHAAHFYADGALHIRVLSQNRLAWIVNARTRDPGMDDFYAEVDMTDIAGVAEAENGFVFRYHDGDNFYIFGVSGHGTYHLQRCVAGEWQEVIPWSASPHLRTGSGTLNRISVLAQGASITLFANDQFLATVEDSSLARGGIGLLATAYAESGVEIAFDNFALWSLGSPLAPTVTATPTVASTATSTITSTVTATSILTAPAGLDEELVRIRASDPTFSDDFRANNGHWTFGTDGPARMKMTGREVHIIAEEELVLATLTHDLELGDLYAEADFRHVGPPSDAEYGLTFRWDETTDSAISFLIDASGSFEIERRVDGNWEPASEWTPSDALASGPDASNRLGVLARGATIYFVANNQVIAQMEDPDPHPGRIALVGGSFLDPDVEIALDNFDLWDLTSDALP